MKKTLAALAVLALASTAAPAFAGECPANQMGTNPLTGAATMPSRVTDTVVGAIDLGPEIAVTGRSLRLRRLVLQPGGVVPLHTHTGRPAIIMTATGTVTEYRSTCMTPIVHRAGDVVREVNGTQHWWRNNGRTAVVLYSSDVHNDGQ
jgi:quercetin dioxygenase-like cupin family protein